MFTVDDGELGGLAATNTAAIMTAETAMEMRKVERRRGDTTRTMGRSLLESCLHAYRRRTPSSGFALHHARLHQSKRWRP